MEGRLNNNNVFAVFFPLSSSLSIELRLLVGLVCQSDKLCMTAQGDDLVANADLDCGVGEGSSDLVTAGVLVA